MCLAQGPQRSDAGEALSQVKHSTTEPLRPLIFKETNNILIQRIEIGVKKMILEIKFYFFIYFLQNYSRGVRKSTNKIILA